MANKKTHKKKVATMKTREQKLAEEKALKEKARKRNLTILISAIVVVALLIASLTTLIIVRNTADPKRPGLKRSGKAYETVYVKMTVENYGDIVLKLDGKEAPKTVSNFVKLVDEGFYNGLTFHRVISEFMIQGGDPNGDGTGGNVDANGDEVNIKGEFDNNGHANDISHKRGVISMARSGNQYYPALAYNTASSQFFICNADSPHLDGDDAAFGYVIAGLDVVDSITEYGAHHTNSDTNGIIADKETQPKIISVVEITEEEAMSYAK